MKRNRMLALPLAVWSALVLWAVPPAGNAAEFATRASMGAITFKATPKGMVKSLFRVDVVVDTHSGSLSDLNLQQQTVLRVGSAEYRPKKPVRLSGHHGEVTLLFDVPQAPGEFELVITGVPGVGEVRLGWP